MRLTLSGSVPVEAATFRLETNRDVPADNPVETLDRFTEGLRRVLAASKANTKGRLARKRKRKRAS